MKPASTEIKVLVYKDNYRSNVCKGMEGRKANLGKKFKGRRRVMSRYLRLWLPLCKVTCMAAGPLRAADCPGLPSLDHGNRSLLCPFDLELMKGQLFLCPGLLHYPV